MNTLHTTTEELIVAYLDGELIRKEMETLLFERLATSEDARTVLREHLIVRGAIRDSATDERFQLSANLDERTKSRLERVLRAIPTHTPAFAADAAAVPASQTARSLRRFALRPSLVALLLLLAIGGTYYLTSGTKTEPQQLAVNNQPAVTAPAITSTPAPATEKSVAVNTPAPEVRTVIQKVYVPVAVHQAASKDLAQNVTPTAGSVQSEQATSNEEDPAAIMASHRLSKMLHSTKTVVVSREDRL